MSNRGYTLPMIVISFAGLAIIAWLVDLPLWMVGVGAILAVVGYLLERRPRA